MSTDERHSGEERLTSLMLAYQEALATGTPLPDPQEYLGNSGPEVLARWHQARAGLDLLAQAGPADLTLPDALPPPPSAAPRPAPLPALPGYELQGELGRGGMGVVYKAFHLELQRVVALKMILAGEHARAAQRERFQREAKAVARLQHPNVVQIFEVGEHDGLPFLALELCSGGSLESKLDGAPRPAVEAAGLIRTLAAAMHHAHRRGIVHRDLKPANVLFTDDGLPRVSDFGLAKCLSEEARPLTESGNIVGTAEYMSPEQAGGTGKEVGPAADVWALGAILYEMLTGQPPFRADNKLKTLLAVLGADPVAPRRLVPRVPRDLETICLKCLRKEPSRRYASAAALADDLGRFLAGEPVRARAISPLERGARWARRRPALALAALFLLAALVGMGGWAWKWRQEQLRQRAEDEARQAHVEHFAAVSFRKSGPVGVGSLTEDQARRRNKTYRLSRRGRRGRVEKVEVVNGLGCLAASDGTIISTIIEKVGPLEDWRQARSVECRYDQEGRLLEQIATDRAGRVVWGFHFTSPTRAHFTNERGYIARGKGSEAAYVEFVWDEDGLAKEHLYRDSFGQPRPSPGGVYGRRYKYDRRGLTVEATFLNAEGKPARSRDGYATIKVRYDEQGNDREAAYFDVDGQPTLNKQGFARCEARCDEQGNVVEAAWFGVDGKPRLLEHGFAKAQYRYDGRGNKVEAAYVDADGKPTLIKYGYARARRCYDEQGNIVEQSFFRLDGRPTLHKEGYAVAKHRYDERGNKVEQSCFDLDGKPTRHRDGYAWLTSKYDERGNRVEESYFGLDGKLTSHKIGYAKVAWKYDERGNQVEEAYFGIDGKPTRPWSRWAKVVLTYDDRGNVLTLAYFGVDGKPSLHKLGYAKVAWKYDDRGNMAEMSYFDATGQPALHRNGYHRVTLQYDERGNRTEWACFGTDGKPCLDRSDGTHRTTWKYDGRGNRIEQAHFDATGKLIKVAAGHARWTARYDRQDNQIDVTYFDEAGRPLRAQVVITEVVPGGQGARAGLRAGDVVLTYDGEAARNTFALIAATRRRASAKAGEVPLQVRRSGKVVRSQVRPGLLGVVIEDRVVPE